MMESDITTSRNGAHYSRLGRSGFSTSLEENNSQSLIEKRLFLLIAILLLQVGILKVTLSPSVPEYQGPFRIVADFVQPTMYFIIAFVLLISTRIPEIWQKLVGQCVDYKWRKYLGPQLIGCVGILLSAAQLFPTNFTEYIGEGENVDLVWTLILFLCSIATAVFSLLLLAPSEFWFNLAKSEKLPIMLALLFCIAAYIVGSLVQRSWDILSEPTMHMSKWILDLLYQDTQADFQQAILGTSHFAVTIKYQCSGYEGIGMMIVFLTWYILSFKKDLRFPHVYLILPIGIVTIWLFNALRIALLIAIGSSISQDVAINGFHSSAGWISFIGVALVIFFFTRRSSFFSKSPVPFFRSISINASNAALIPMLVLLTATLISISFSGSFTWLYPIRVIAVGATIWLLWSYFDFGRLSVKAIPIIVGILVFFIWIALVPVSEEKDREFAENLFAAPYPIVGFWLLSRIIGTVLIVPIAEELAFRRYILSFFNEKVTDEARKKRIQWAPMMVSSILFGIFHSAWIAGTIAGIAYFLMQKRSGKLWDAVVAHMTTNFLLSAYVLSSGKWSYW